MLGLDIASAMIAEARRRCDGLDNVTLRAVSGADLSDIPAGSSDLVLAVDSFPYLEKTGVRNSSRLTSPRSAACWRPGETS